MPAIANDLMNADRSFRQRTGLDVTPLMSLIKDHGFAGIGGLQVKNQERMNRRFPVPPAFK